MAADKTAIAEEVKGWTEALMDKPDVMLRQKAVIQLACAAVQALTGDSSAPWEAAHLKEQQLLQLALDGMYKLPASCKDDAICKAQTTSLWHAC